MVTWYWSADTLFWQVWINHNMDVQYQRYIVNQGCRSLPAYYLEYGRHVARLRRRRRRAYAPTRNTASHDNHWKINSWVSFSFPYENGAPLGGPLGRQSSAKKGWTRKEKDQWLQKKKKTNGKSRRVPESNSDPLDWNVGANHSSM